MKTLNSFKYFFFVILLAFSLGACISYQIKDASDAAMTAKYTIAGINNSIATLATSGGIDKATAKAMADKVDQATATVVTAEGLIKQGKPQDALGLLTAANQILLQLQKELQSKQPQPGVKSP
jgi:hypothetical protein